MKTRKIWIVAAVLVVLAGIGIATCCTKETPTGDGSKSPAGRSITAEQFEHRMILLRAMLAHGFKPLDSEWWHFTLKEEPFPDTYFTFPIK